MLAPMARLLVVKATAGADAPERCSQAFTVASTAVASGVDVSFWLLISNGRVTACTQCAARRDIGPGDVLDGIRIAGAAVFVEEIMTDGAQAIVY
jgi:predicted peroxiredoxin